MAYLAPNSQGANYTHRIKWSPSTTQLIESGSIYDVLAKRPEYSRFISVVIQAGMSDLLAVKSEHSLYTVFAFSNENLLANANYDTHTSRKLLKNLILPFELHSEEFEEHAHYVAFSGDRVAMKFNPLRYGDERLTAIDIVATNGVIHAIV